NRIFEVQGVAKSEHERPVLAWLEQHGRCLNVRAMVARDAGEKTSLGLRREVVGCEECNDGHPSEGGLRAHVVNSVDAVVAEAHGVVARRRAASHGRRGWGRLARRHAEGACDESHGEPAPGSTRHVYPSASSSKP